MELDRNGEFGAITCALAGITRGLRTRKIARIGEILPGGLDEPLRIGSIVGATTPDLEMQMLDALGIHGIGVDDADRRSGADRLLGGHKHGREVRIVGCELSRPCLLYTS